MECGTWMEKDKIHSLERRLDQNSDKIRKSGQKNVAAKDDLESQQCRITEEHLSQRDECQLVIQGLLILEKLSCDDHNCIQICNAQLLITHILAWVFSRPFLKHGEKGHWVNILTLSFGILARLASIRGQPAGMVRDKIIFELYPSCISGYANHPEVRSKAIYTFSHAYTRETFSNNDELEKKKWLCY